MYSTSTPFCEYLQGEQIKYLELKLEDIQKLKDSLVDDATLPPISDKKYLAFLHSCHFDIELAKTTIKKCYKYHFDVPQVFSNLDPLAEEIEKNYKCTSIGQMPTTNIDKSDRYLYLQFTDYNHESFDFLAFYRYLTMYLDYTQMMYGTCDGLVAVIDSKGLNWRHIMKIPLVISAKMMKYMEGGLSIRLKSIHVLNTGSAAQMAMKIITQFGIHELINKIKLHSVGSEEIFNYVPKHIMPVEMGGLGKSHYLFNDELYNNMIDIRDYYLERNEVLNNHILYLNQNKIEENQ